MSKTADFDCLFTTVPEGCASTVRPMTNQPTAKPTANTDSTSQTPKPTTKGEL